MSPHEEGRPGIITTGNGPLDDPTFRAQSAATYTEDQLSTAVDSHMSSQDPVGFSITIFVPQIAPDATNLEAALTYADAGIYVLPVSRGTKKPGSVVGTRWQGKSSRDPKVIAGWFAGTDHDIAWHCGRSGLLVFDVDYPDRVPEVLARHLGTAPLQTTRLDAWRRGHYVFAMPPGRSLGNGTGKLGGEWGEVRGLNGVIIAANSHHAGGEYRWKRTGLVPVLPDELADLLDDASPASAAATDASVRAFLAAHTQATRPEVLCGLVKALHNHFETGSRHMGAVSVTAGALKEARAGYVSAQTVLDTLMPMFVAAATRAPTGGEKQRTEAEARDEYMAIFAWCVPQADAADLNEVRARTNGKMPDNVVSERIDPNEATPHDHSDAPLEAATTSTIDGMPRLWPATELNPETAPRWLAKNRIPRAAATLLVGDEGIGKSLLWVWMIAYVTTGKASPEFGIPAREPSLVFIVITEDGWADTVLPRLKVAGADLNLIRVICTEKDGSGSPIFPRDLHLIRDADPAPALIVVDAWLDTVPVSLTVRDPQQARQALHPWKELATTTDAAVLLLCHTNRVATPNARDRYGATGELRKKARMTLFAQQGEDGCLLVGPEKTNTAKVIPASKFTITSVKHFEATDDHDGTVPLLSYAGESDQTARDHITDAYVADHDTGSSDSGDALGWLAAELAGGPRWAGDIETAAEVAGHTTWKLKRAKRTLHVKSVRDGATGSWFWKLTHHDGPPRGARGCDDPISPPLDPLTPCPPTTFQGNASTSQDGKRMNGETQAPRIPLPSVGDLYGNTCRCGKAPARHDSGLCEFCTAAKNSRTR